MCDENKILYFAFSREYTLAGNKDIFLGFYPDRNKAISLLKMCGGNIEDNLYIQQFNIYGEIIPDSRETLADINNINKKYLVLYNKEGKKFNNIVAIYNSYQLAKEFIIDAQDGTNEYRIKEIDVS